MKDFFQSLFEYNRDINEKMIRHISEHKKDDDDRVVHLFSHVLNAHHIWNHRVEGSSTSMSVFDQHKPEHWEEINTQNFDLSMSILNDTDLDAHLPYTNSRGEEFNSHVKDIFFHVINHSNYHRAQVNSRLVELDIPAVSTDYIFYKR